MTRINKCRLATPLLLEVDGRGSGVTRGADQHPSARHADAGARHRMVLEAPTRGGASAPQLASLFAIALGNIKDVEIFVSDGAEGGESRHGGVLGTPAEVDGRAAVPH